MGLDVSTRALRCCHSCYCYITQYIYRPVLPAPGRQCGISSDEHDSVNTKKEDLRKSYPDRFENFDGEFHITTDRNVTPIVHAPRKCPIHMREEIKSELENMESLGVIKIVTQPTDWV